METPYSYFMRGCNGFYTFIFFLPISELWTLNSRGLPHVETIPDIWNFKNDDYEILPDVRIHKEAQNKKQPLFLQTFHVK